MDYALARRNMVESQLRTNEVRDPELLRALAETPRELFLPAERRSVAYIDDDLWLSADRFLLEPMVLARLLQAAEIRRSDAALDVGCATGYSTAILAQLAGSVVALESDLDLARRAEETLARLAIDNATLVRAPLAGGYPP